MRYSMMPTRLVIMHTMEPPEKDPFCYLIGKIVIIVAVNCTIQQIYLEIKQIK